ncbi:hypothetical protein HDR62_02105 [bacterium]|nr:hypothetical protein [bacterium]
MKKFLIVPLALLWTSAAFAQKYGATPEDSLTCLQNLSVYQEFYKQKNYNDAYDAWKQVLTVCPATSINTYIRGAAILKTRINKAPDAEARAGYIDELLNLYDLRMNYFGDPGLCKGMKAKDMTVYKPKQIREALALYEEALTQPSKQRTYCNVPYNYFECVIEAFKADILTKADIINAYEKAIAVLDGMAAARPGDTLPASTEAAITHRFEPYAACEDLINIYTEKFEANQENADYLRKATALMDNRSCTDNDIFFKMAEALYKLEPTPESAYQMASMNRSRKQYAAVVDYLTLEVMESIGEAYKERAYLVLAEAYMNLGQSVNARNACREVLNLNPESGRAYLLMGLIYAGGASSCTGDGSPIAARAPYWAAVDMFNKAKSVDPSLNETVASLVSSYSAHFPSSDDLFTYGFKEGESYNISCWFNHTTTIRARR